MTLTWSVGQSGNPGQTLPKRFHRFFGYLYRQALGAIVTGFKFRLGDLKRQAQLTWLANAKKLIVTTLLLTFP